MRYPAISFQNIAILALVALLSNIAPSRADLISRCSTLCVREYCDPKDWGRDVKLCWRSCEQRCPGLVKVGATFPKYHVLSFFYAPPGCTSAPGAPCVSQSSVEYSAGSSLGHRISLQSSFKDGTESSSDITASYAGIISLTKGDSSGFSTTLSSSETTTISKSESTTFHIPAGGGDGIDHSQDQVLLLLNPAFTVQAYRTTTEWSFGYTAPSAQLFTVYVRWLTNPGTMPAPVAEALRKQGIDEQDYRAILSFNPFAYGPAAIDERRFLRTTTTFPYEPPLRSPRCPNGICDCATIRHVIKNDFQAEESHGYQWQYTVGSTTAGSLFGSLSLKSGDSQTISVSSSETNIKSTTNSALLTIDCPSVSYTGPPLMAVYWDTLFGTFMFSALDPEKSGLLLVQRGVLRTASGDPLPHQKLTLAVGRREYVTYSDNAGAYSFYADPLMPNGAIATLSAGKTTKVVKIGDPELLSIQISEP